MKKAKRPKYRRILLKLSGEALGGGKSYGIDNPTLLKIARQVKQVTQMGVGVGIVVFFKYLAKLKFLLPVLKTGGTMILSIGVYAL